MIGKRDDRRKEDAVKKAELELKKKKEEAVREVCVATSWPTADDVPADMFSQTADAVIHVLPAQHGFGSCEYTVSKISGERDANHDISIALPSPRGMSVRVQAQSHYLTGVRIPTSSQGQ